MRDLRYDLFLAFLAGVLGMAIAAFLAWRRMMDSGE